MSSNTKIVPPGIEKFTLPDFPIFTGNGPWFSVLSLLGFLIASVAGIVALGESSIWLRLPLYFTALGSGIGFLFELWLIASGRPYQLFASKGGRFIQSLRAFVMVFVFGSSYFAYATFAFSPIPNPWWIQLGIGLLVGALFVSLLYQAPRPVVILLFSVGLVFQAWTILESGSELQTAHWYLIGAASLLFLTILIGAETPIQSTLFHVAGIASVVLYFMGFKPLATNNLLGPTWIGLLWLLAGFALGLLLTFNLLPKTWGRCRTVLANLVWPLFYLVIAGGLYIPRPEQLSVLYRGKEDQLKPLQVLPYHVAHPRNLSYPVQVPCLDEALTLKVHAFGFLTRMVKFFFAIASIVMRWFPFAKIDTPISQKPRMEVWSDGSHYWPGWLERKIWLPGLGRFEIQSGVRGPGFQPTPELAVDAYKEGQLLAYLVEYGIAGSFIEAEKRGKKTVFKLDFSFLEKYETKPDYESYGGKAYLEINDDRQCFEVISVCGPGSDVEIPVSPDDSSFRHAEDQILASLYFYVVSGKHLVEIHMGLNLVEIALFNAFDAKKDWGHPIRMVLYPHLFAHELAEELTTQNLLEDGAVFPQIFATTNAALMRHLNDRFSEYVLGGDENFKRREKTILANRTENSVEEVLPRSSLVWETKYARIWQEYATEIVDATYRDDTEVENDECVATLFSNLSELFHQPLPRRYEKLKTKTGLARFVSDTIHHLVIRHEVYGTTGVRLSLDPRINKVQVPKDGGTYPIDEWRSLACVAMATSRVRYTSLLINFSNVFNDIEDEDLRTEFRLAHTRMKAKLQELEEKFTTDGVDNYQRLRLLPSDLDIGAGY